jgi:Fe-S oxidoreductase
MIDDAMIPLNECPHCQFRMEIVAVKLKLFRKSAVLLACPGCRLIIADGPKNPSGERLGIALSNQNDPK